MKFRHIAITIMSGLLVIQPFSATAGFFDLPGYPAAYPESAIVSPSTVEVGGTVTLKIRVVAGDRDLNSNLDAYAITSTARKIYLGPIATRISGTNKDGIYQVVFKVLEYGSPSNTHTGDWKLGIIPADFTVTGYGYFFPFTVIDAVAPTPKISYSIISSILIAQTFKAGGNLNFTFLLDTNNPKVVPVYCYIDAFVKPFEAIRVAGTSSSGTYTCESPIPNKPYELFPSGRYPLDILVVYFDEFGKQELRQTFGYISYAIPTPTPTIKKSSTVKCNKGKLTKTVTGINPKCPTG